MSVNSKQYLYITPYNLATPPATADQQSFNTYLVRELRRLQATLKNVIEAANQALDVAPTNPRYGTVRYATGGWATALGSTGLYCYKDNGVWTKIV